MNERTAGLLSRSSWLTIGSIAVLLLIDRLVVQPPLVRLATDAPVINVAGRQRMLSQRLAKAALALDRAGAEGDRGRYQDELRRVLDLWARSHDGLRRGDPALMLPGGNSPAVRRAFDDLEPHYRTVRLAAEAIARGDPGGADPLAVILATEPEYLARMDRIVGLFEAESRARVDRLIRTGWMVTGLVLGSLIGIGGLIVRPAERLIRAQLAELRAARDELEARVRERTESLERALGDLRREVGERERAEQRQRALLEQFGHVARTNVVGEMASGLAHEINQPLGAIANYAEGCLVTLDGPDPRLDDVRAALGRILALTLRSGAIIRRIRRFVTRHEPIVEPIAPNDLILEVVALCRGDAERLGIALIEEPAPDLPTVQGDPVQLQQVLVNLVRNAMDAISSAQPTDPAILLTTNRDDSGGVEFAVIDNGEGIAGDAAGRLFDAFFSTRAEGMGMGLAISRTIVEAHQGRIGFESEPGTRTTFRFSIPVGGDDAPGHGLPR